MRKRTTSTRSKTSALRDKRSEGEKSARARDMSDLARSGDGGGPRSVGLRLTTESCPAQKDGLFFFPMTVPLHGQKWSYP